jgi:hypothetical protein
MYEERVSGTACEVSQEGCCVEEKSTKREYTRDSTYRKKEKPMRHGKSPLVPKPACEGKYEIPARAVADEDYLAFRASDFVFSHNMCIDGSCVLDYGREVVVLE